MNRRRRAYKPRLEPTLDQLGDFRRYTGCRRWVWNRALALQKQRLKEGLHILSYYELAKHLTAWRNDPETSWLSEGPVHTQQATLRDLDTAFKRYFSKQGKYPRFKKKGVHESIRYPDCKQIKFDFTTTDPDGRTIWPSIFFPKVGWVKFRQSQEFVGKVCNATVTCEAGHWYASIQVEQDPDPEPIPRTDDNTVGGDIGLVHFLVLSDDEEIDKPEHFKPLEERLAKAQAQLSRMKQGSNNYKEKNRYIQKLHRKIARARDDFLHKKSDHIAKNHLYVVLEDAKIQRMIQREKADQPEDTQSHAKSSRFNRRLLDIGWGKFLFYLSYKLRARGGALILVNPAYTSQECSCCGSIHEANRPTRDRFHCLACHHDEQADHNAAKVILRRAGPAQVACATPSNGGSSREGQTES